MAKRSFKIVLLLAVVAVAGIFLSFEQSPQLNGFSLDKDTTSPKLPGDASASGKSIDLENGSQLESLEEAHESSEHVPEADESATTRIRHSIDWNVESDPARRYQENYSAALAGDPYAQFHVASAILECKEAPRDELLRDLLKDESRSEDVKDIYALKAQHCAQLHSMVSKLEEQDAVETWLNSAAASNHPLAKLLLKYFDNIGLESNDRLLIERALTLRDPAILTVMTAYHASSDNSDPIEVRAWLILKCEYETFCNVDDYYSGLEVGESPYFRHAVLARLQSIERAFREQEYYSLMPVY